MKARFRFPISIRALYFPGRLLTFLFTFIVFTLISSYDSYARAQEDSTGIEKWPKYNFIVGGYLTNVQSNFRFSGEESGIGLDISFEDALGLNSTSLTTRGQFSFRYSKNRKNAIHASFFQIRRRAKKELESQLGIRDIYLPEGAQMRSELKINVFKVDYRHSLILDERTDLYFSAGFYIMPMEIVLDSDGIIEEHTNFIAPLPALGIGNSFYLTDNLLLHNSLTAFYLKVDKYTGNMLDLSVLLEYNILDWLSVGAGFNSFNIDIEAIDQKSKIGLGFDGNIGYKHSGLLFYTRLYF